MKTITVGFKLYGKGITNLIHQLIDEGATKGAWNIINCFELSPKQKQRLYDGTAIIGDKDGVPFYVEKPYIKDEAGLDCLQRRREELIAENRFGYYRNAWISPEGEFFGCGMYGHIGKSLEIAEKMGIKTNHYDESRYLEDHGWLKLSDLKLFYDKDEDTITQKQVDTIFDYLTQTDHPIYLEMTKFTKDNFEEFLNHIIVT
jgi:hypothetical protein